MALFALGDTHLSLGANKPMDVFGGIWEGYVDKLLHGFSIVKPEDTVILAGDISWGMSLEQAKPDFDFLHNHLPGKKILLKGNHDYWWMTATKMNRFFEEQNYDDFEILHNNYHLYGDVALCGTRGWFYEEDELGQGTKVFNRELGRLETSLKEAGEREKLVFLHYPPLYEGYECREITEILAKYNVKKCYYGHLHGGSHRLAVEGERGGIEYRLIAADYLHFAPKLILP